MAQALGDDAWWAAQTTAEGPHAGKAWWGWGAVGELRKEVERRLEAHPGERVLRPPTVEEAARALPPPRVALDALPAAVRRCCTVAPFDRLLHSRGRDMIDIIRNVRGAVAEAHDLVAYPASEEEVAAVLGECARLRIAVVPFGGGSSVVGGVLPPPADEAGGRGFVGSLALDLALMDRVLEVDEVSQCARVQGGIYGPALEAQLRQHGLTLRYYPQSFEYSTLGGWLATRGGGHFATGPTHVDDLVQAARLVGPGGVSESRRLPASGAGPAEHRLYLGSEGALGVITEAWVRLRRRPQARASATVLFGGGDADDAFIKGARAVRDLAQTGLQPANLRLVYGPEVALVAGGGLPEAQAAMLGRGAVLLLGLEAPTAGAAAEAALDAELALLLDLASSPPHGGLVVSKKTAAGSQAGANSQGEREGLAGSWGQGFMKGGYSFSASCLLPSMLVNTFETACTWAAFPTFHAAVLSAARQAAERVCGPTAEATVTCRFTHVYPDGPAPYYTVVVRNLPQGSRWHACGPETSSATEKEDPRIEMWLAIKKAAMDTIIAHGGTSTHHHAVGRLHHPHYEAERGALFGEALAAAKAVYDPTGIMNPGVIVAAGAGAPPSRL